MKSNDVLGFWKEDNLTSFNEMIISWNGQRPINGKIDIYASVKLEEWTPWLPYASWGTDSQSSYNCRVGQSKVDGDIFQVLDGVKATGFQIQVDAPLRLHVYTNGEKRDLKCSYSPLYLKMKGLSQMTLDHPRSRDLCSPTSTTAVVSYLSKKQIDPIVFAERAKDHASDIFGNWVLNVAESWHYLGPTWDAWVQKLSGFPELYEKLVLGTPVIVSVRGPLAGSAQPYAKGHLLVVTGFDPGLQMVHCMDPAFSTDEKTDARYPLNDFLAAWGRRGNLAYIFTKRRAL